MPKYKSFQYEMNKSNKTRTTQIGSDYNKELIDLLNHGHRPDEKIVQNFFFEVFPKHIYTKEKADLLDSFQDAYAYLENETRGAGNPAIVHSVHVTSRIANFSKSLFHAQLAMLHDVGETATTFPKLEKIINSIEEKYNDTISDGVFVLSNQYDIIRKKIKNGKKKDAKAYVSKMRKEAERIYSNLKTELKNKYCRVFKNFNAALDSIDPDKLETKRVGIIHFKPEDELRLRLHWCYLNDLLYNEMAKIQSHEENDIMRAEVKGVDAIDNTRTSKTAYLVNTYTSVAKALMVYSMLDKLDDEKIRISYNIDNTIARIKKSLNREIVENIEQIFYQTVNSSSERYNFRAEHYYSIYNLLTGESIKINKNKLSPANFKKVLGRVPLISNSVYEHKLIDGISRFGINEPWNEYAVRGYERPYDLFEPSIDIEDMKLSEHIFRAEAQQQAL